MTNGRPVRDIAVPDPGARGVAAVEFALVVPLLVILLFIIVIGGGVYLDQLNMQSAARNAARVGSVDGSKACTVAGEELRANSVGDVTCDIDKTCESGAFQVSLTARRWVQVPLVGSREVVLHASSTYVCS